jgi:hypothetical protein
MLILSTSLLRHAKQPNMKLSNEFKLAMLVSFHRFHVELIMTSLQSTRAKKGGVYTTPIVTMGETAHDVCVFLQFPLWNGLISWLGYCEAQSSSARHSDALRMWCPTYIMLCYWAISFRLWRLKKRWHLPRVLLWPINPFWHVMYEVFRLIILHYLQSFFRPPQLEKRQNLSLLLLPQRKRPQMVYVSPFNSYIEQANIIFSWLWYTRWLGKGFRRIMYVTFMCILCCTTNKVPQTFEVEENVISTCFTISSDQQIDQRVCVPFCVDLPSITLPTMSFQAVSASKEATAAPITPTIVTEEETAQSVCVRFQFYIQYSHRSVSRLHRAY